jgi:hypothetical protein
MDGSSRILVVKKDSMGTVTILQKTFGKENVNVYADRIVSDGDDGYFVLGRYQAPLALLYYMARLDAQFNVLRDTIFFAQLGTTNLNWNWGRDLILTSDNHLVLTGASNVFLQTSHLSVKLDTSFNVVWSMVDSMESLGASIKQNAVGNYIVGGSVNDTGWDVMVREYDRETGNLLRSVVKDNYGGTGERVYDLQIAANGNICVAGRSDTVVTGATPINLIALFDDNLNFITRYTEGPGLLLTPGRELTSVVILDDVGEEFVAVGREWLFDDSRAVLRRIDVDPVYGCSPSGTRAWESPGKIRVYPNPASDLVHIENDGIPASPHLLIRDISGKIMYECHHPQDMWTISTAGWTAGLYVIYIDGAGTYKLIRH